MKAVFLDRDGVLNPLIYDAEHGVYDSPLNPDQFSLMPGAAEGIQMMNRAGIPIVLASNQPGIAKGKISKALFDQIDRKMQRVLRKLGCYLDGVYYCLHHPEGVDERYRGDCSCRKPKSGLLTKAAEENGFELEESFLIGDGLTDIEAGLKAGCKTILVGTEKCDICRKSAELGVKPDYIAPNLYEAARVITGGDNGNLCRFGEYR